MTPQQAKTFDQICDLPRDNIGGDGWWAIVDEASVSITRQEAGESPREEITLTRPEFNALVTWYTTGKWKKPRPSRSAP